jgi:hypothetical protein
MTAITPLPKNHTFKPLIYISTDQLETLESNQKDSKTKADQSQSPSVATLAGIAAAGFLPVIGGPLAAYALGYNIFSNNNDSKDFRQSQESPPSDTDKVARVLDKLNLEALSTLVDIVPFSALPEDLDFPPGHPLPGEVYRVHPLKERNRQYIPVDAYETLLYQEREAELIRLLIDLGASKIEVSYSRTGQTKILGKAEVGVPQMAEAKAGIDGNYLALDVETRTFNLTGRSSSDLNFDPKTYAWLPYEPSWNTVVHARLMSGGCSSAAIELTRNNSYSGSADFKMDGFLQDIAKAEIGGGFSRTRQQDNIIRVEFST